jgi:hypothetical protein
VNDNDVETVVRDREERDLLSLVLDVCTRRGVLLHEICGRSHHRSAS